MSRLAALIVAGLAGLFLAFATAGAERPPDFCVRHPGNPNCTSSSSSTTTASSTTTTTTSSTTATATGCVEPTDPARDRWYACSSPFNTPIPASPKVSPDSQAQISWLTAHNIGFPPTINSVPSAWVGSSSTPPVTVQRNYPSCGVQTYQLPIPADAKPGAGSYANDVEPTMLVMNATTGQEWDLFQVTMPGVAPLAFPTGAYTCQTNDFWNATAVVDAAGGWKGSGSGHSTRGSGTLSGTGLLRPRDTRMAAGPTWDHAVAVSYPHTRNAFVAPATATDGPNTDAASIPMGARLQLDPAFNVEALAVPEWMKQELRTAQKYGYVVVDSGNGTMVNEGYASAKFDGYVWPWESTLDRLWIPAAAQQRLRVVYP